jgi:hypothetical protein
VRVGILFWLVAMLEEARRRKAQVERGTVDGLGL